MPRVSRLVDCGNIVGQNVIAMNATVRTCGSISGAISPRSWAARIASKSPGTVSFGYGALSAPPSSASHMSIRAHCCHRGVIATSMLESSRSTSGSSVTPRTKSSKCCERSRSRTASYRPRLLPKW